MTNAFFGAMKVPLIYLAARFCNCDPSWAFVAAFLPAVDNAFVTESRLILTDGILHCFTAFAIFSIAFANSRNNYTVSIALVAISCACASSVKFTALGIYFPVALVFLLNYKFIYSLLAGAIILLTFFFIVIVSFMIHLLLLKYPSNDCTYHSNRFCNKLTNLTVTSSYRAVLELIPVMLETNLALNKTHHWSSQWYQWPFMAGRATYMYLDPNDQNAQIWCIGTPTVWFMALCGMITYIVLFCYRKPLCARHFWLLAGYFASYMPFILIRRVIFNYHYLIPLMFSILMGCVACQELFGSSWPAAIFICTLNFLIFLHFAPLTYAQPIEYSQFVRRMWFNCWMTPLED